MRIHKRLDLCDEMSFGESIVEKKEKSEKNESLTKEKAEVETHRGRTSATSRIYNSEISSESINESIIY